MDHAVRDLVMEQEMLLESEKFYLLLIEKIISVTSSSHIYTLVSNNYINNCSVVDGGWSNWEYRRCSKTCGGGTQLVTRQCNNPNPSCGGNHCHGSRYSTVRCNDVCCPGKT